MILVANQFTWAIFPPLPSWFWIISPNALGAGGTVNEVLAKKFASIGYKEDGNEGDIAHGDVRALFPPVPLACPPLEIRSRIGGNALILVLMTSPFCRILSSRPT